MNPAILNSLDIIFSLTIFLLPPILGYIYGRLTNSQNMAATLLNFYVFFAIGIQGTVVGFVQMFKPEWVVEYVQWPFSQFLTELGMANFSFGMIGLAFPWTSKGWRNAAAAGYSIFLFLTFIKHIIEIVRLGFYSGNSGAFLLIDFFVPLILVILLFQQNKK